MSVIGGARSPRVDAPGGRPVCHPRLACLPVEVGFVLNEEETERFLVLLREEELELFYVKFPVEYGVLSK